MTDLASITPQELASLATDADIDLIDVRTPAEFREVHLQLARNVPLDSLDPEQLLASRNGNTDKPLYVICQSGTRSQIACRKFLAVGFERAVSIAGGTVACVSAGLPVVRGKKAISLERQVRIAAGFLVLVGAGLSFVHPALVGIAAFIGAGLMFAGITNTCGMGMLLAKMPWNQVGTEET